MIINFANWAFVAAISGLITAGLVTNGAAQRRPRRTQQLQQQLPTILPHVNPQQDRPRADQVGLFNDLSPRVVRHNRKLFSTNNGKVSKDRDSTCHAFCKERTILALHDVLVDEHTGYPMCPLCIKKHDLFLPEGEEDVGEVADEFTEHTTTQGDHRTDIEYEGSKDEMMEMLNKADLIISRYKFNDEEVKTAIENLKEKKIFTQHYARGFLSTGLQWVPTRKLLMEQPAFKDFLEFWEENDDPIQHGFFGHTTMDGTGHHPIHFDGKLAGSCVRRTIATLGDSEKTMTIQNVENGRWFSFKVPHGVVVTMSELGNGTLGRTYVHSVDACKGTYILAVEQ